MLITIVLAVIMMAGLFLMLLAGVGFIQDKKYFTSAPKAVQDTVLPKEERFLGQHIIGWILMALSLLILAGPLVYAAIDGLHRGFTYGEFFLRYVVMLLLLKAFDICFFDWYLLCRSNFYSHFFPECKEVLGPHLFGFNKQSHIIQVVVCILASAALAGICVCL